MAVARAAQAAGVMAAAERRQAVILCAELRGFARMSDVLEPALVLLLASEFFTFAAEIVGAHGGDALSVHNESLLAAFAREEPAKFVQQSVRAAQKIQGGFPALAERWRKAYGLRSGAAQGLHFGEIVFGAAGPRGREQRMAIGDNIAVAQLMLRRARAGEFVMSDAVMAAVSVENLDLDAQPLPPLEIGKRPPIRIYGVLRDERLDFT
ncbi:MAG: adenylate/guanylate cyclase domain-containing protein [Burkholderiales bacterium]